MPNWSVELKEPGRPDGEEEEEQEGFLMRKVEDEETAAEMKTLRPGEWGGGGWP